MSQPGFPPKQDLDRSYLECCASLIDQVDKKVLVVLRDNRSIVGVLRSCDQFNNMLLFDTAEHIHLDGEYCEIPLGVFVVRGDNVQLVGTVGAAQEANMRKNYKQIPSHVMLGRKRDREERDKIVEAKMTELAKKHGFFKRED